MKKSLYYLTMIAGMLLFSLSTHAQQHMQTPASPKPPEAAGKKLQSDKLANVTEPVVSPVVADQAVTIDPKLKSSEANPKITKMNEQEQSKASQTNIQPVSSIPPRTDNLVMPKNLQKDIPDSKSPTAPAKINQ